MPVILVTGFGPFDGITINPSQLLAERLDGETIGSVCVVGFVLPVEFGADAVLLKKAVAEFEPWVVLCLGVAAGSDGLRVETTARNVRQSGRGRIPIVTGAPDHLSTTIPVQAVVAAIRDAEVPVQISNDTGSYLCNHVLFTTLLLARRGAGVPQVGFIHIPHASEYAPAGCPSLPLDVIECGVRAAIDVLARIATGSAETCHLSPLGVSPACGI